MNFGTELKEHLASYKRLTLGVQEDGTWRGHSYPHILPKELEHLNLIESIRDDCLSYRENSGIKLHEGFHHLNSSQAFAFNLFFPLLNSGPECQQALLGAMGISGVIRGWHFEAIPDSEEGTNFDLLLELVDGRRIYGEVKLTESAFGSAASNERRQEKRERIYLPRLVGKVKAEALHEGAFYGCYQLLRNLSYVNEPKGSELLLIFPSSNSSVAREAEDFVKLLHESVLPMVRVVDTEQLISRLVSDPRLSEATREMMGEVQSKYVLAEPADA